MNTYDNDSISLITSQTNSNSRVSTLYILRVIDKSLDWKWFVNYFFSCNLFKVQMAHTTFYLESCQVSWFYAGEILPEGWNNLRIICMTHVVSPRLFKLFGWASSCSFHGKHCNGYETVQNLQHIYWTCFMEGSFPKIEAGRQISPSWTSGIPSP